MGIRQTLLEKRGTYLTELIKEDGASSLSKDRGFRAQCSMKVKITLSKTIQIKQFEPLTATIEAEDEVKNTEDYIKLRKMIGDMVADTLANEKERYTK